MVPGSDSPPLSSLELAEVLWLALQMEPVPPPDEEPSSSDGEVVETVRDEPDLSPPPPAAAPERQPVANLATPQPETKALPTKALPVWVPDPPMLENPLDLVRALRPLLRQVEAGSGQRLDERATVERIARTRLWLPVLEPEEEPWFDLILAVDRGASMVLWERLIADVAQLLRRYGAFRNLRVYDIDIDAAAPEADRVRLVIHRPSPPETDSETPAPKTAIPGHRPPELIDQQGRRIAIVLSDCAGSYWWDGTLLPMVQCWGAAMPTVVWQMLPEWMWERTALGRGTPAALSNGLPGAANARLQVEPSEETAEAEMAQGVAVPVITTEAAQLQNWSLMVSGDRREATPGFLLSRQNRAIPQRRTLDELARARLRDQGDEETEDALQAARAQIAEARVQRFRQLSSAQARWLVMRLAAAPVITLPVMRLMRQEVERRERSPLPVAEVFLSGLLERLPQQENTDSTLVQYDFLPHMREALLTQLPAVTAVEVINQVSAAVEERWNRFSAADFRAFLTDPNQSAPAGLEGLRSFASVTARILEQLGIRNDFVDELKRGAGELPAAVEPGGVEWQTLEFETAQLVERGGIPPLQEQTVEVVTVEVEGPLETFTYDVATIERVEEERGFLQRLLRRGSDAQWRIRRQQRQGQRWVERLGTDLELELEMVQIPAGSFLMGSPVDELDRRESEGPQHRVEVESFFMGRYPVTQAQWRFVAGLEAVDRELEADPSYFKGDQRPVEQVSWLEAVEFCARLSAHTGQVYRLPTEAEWEYACRAGTTTPFHFGETITPELANYDGNYTYGEGAKGEYRKETTDVGSLNAANGWGLSDMHGNVWEWCQDHWHDSYGGAPTDGSAWLTENEDASRVIRGGSLYNDPGNCRSASRVDFSPAFRSNDLGFRIVCVAPRAPQ